MDLNSKQQLSMVERISHPFHFYKHYGGNCEKREICHSLLHHRLLLKIPATTFLSPSLIITFGVPSPVVSEYASHRWENYTFFSYVENVIKDFNATKVFELRIISVFPSSTVFYIPRVSQICRTNTRKLWKIASTSKYFFP